MTLSAALLVGGAIAYLLTRAVLRRQFLLEKAEMESAQQELLGRAEADARARQAEGQVRLESAQSQLTALHSALDEREGRLESLRVELSELQQRHAALNVRLEEERQSSQEKLATLQQAREQLSKEFQNLANRIFDEKTDRFSKSSKTLLDNTLSPLKEQMAEFRRRIDQVYASDSEGRVKLLHEITALKNINQQMSEEAVNLTRALKGESKTQGSWGEVILERVLEESGLVKGREYETQLSFTDEQGKRRMPDVVVHLPEDKDVVIDAKVSLVDYERYCSAEDEESRSTALSAHMRSLKNHIEGLSVKDYEGLEGLRSLDFVLIFVPIESAFVAALEHDPVIFRHAWERNIIVVSPTTLLATLRTIQSIWRYERQNRHAENIARRAGQLHDRFVLVLESLEDVGRSIERSQQAYEQTVGRITEGRGNLLRQVEMLEELGAKTKKQIPGSMRERVELDEESGTPPDEEDN